jgi:GlpG protein
MRQVGTLENEREARQFAAWLVSQRIDAHAEAENGGWVVWVREEDQLAKAREGLAQFRANPNDAQYQNAVQAAETLKRQEEAKRRQAQGNVVQMRGRWGSAAPGSGGSRRAPLILTLIGLSALVAIVAYDDTVNREESAKRQPDRPRSMIYRSLTFVDPGTGDRASEPQSNWQSIKRGEVWRLITPAFIHYDWMHIIFNMIWLYSFGTLIEDRRGSFFTLLLVLSLAITSNVGQGVESSFRNYLATFGGMSGVGYGLFGYLAVKAKYDSRERYFLPPGTTFMAMLWFLLCILRDIPPFSHLLADAIPPIANTAHAVGLIVGAVIAYVPLLVRKAA